MLVFCCVQAPSALTPHNVVMLKFYCSQGVLYGVVISYNMHLNKLSYVCILIGAYLWSIEGDAWTMSPLTTFCFFIRLYVTMCLFTNRSQKISKHGKNISMPIFFLVDTTFRCHVWSLTEQMQSATQNMFVNYIMMTAFHNLQQSSPRCFDEDCDFTLCS